MTEMALVADLHGNWPATEAVEKDIRVRGIQRIGCLGDVVGKGPSSDRTFDWAVQNCEFILRGNWDEGIGKRMYPRDRFYYDQLGDSRMETLLTWPMERVFFVSGRKLRLFHGRPTLLLPYYIHEPPEILEPFFLPDYDAVGYADVHRQGMRLLGEKGILFNIGSVGNGLGVPMAQYAILRGAWDSRETAPFDVTFVTVPYDREQTIRDTREAGLRGLANADLFEQEIRTGVYSWGRGKEKPTGIT